MQLSQCDQLFKKKRTDIYDRYDDCKLNQNDKNNIYIEYLFFNKKNVKLTNYVQTMYNL